MYCIVYIATSIDGYIAGPNDELDWLELLPNPEGDSMGYPEMTARVDALLMGRTTFETVLGFGVEWPYEKHVFVLSSSLESIPPELEGKVSLIEGELPEVLDDIEKRGYGSLYIDGGSVIQQALAAGLVDEMILTNIPILLGGGTPLFGELSDRIQFDLEGVSTHLGHLVQRHYVRKSQD